MTSLLFNYRQGWHLEATSNAACPARPGVIRWNSADKNIARFTTWSIFLFNNTNCSLFFGYHFVLQFSKENLRIGSGHNSKAAPFSPSNKYTEESIAETLTSQAEVLAKGVIGYVCLAVAFIVQEWLIEHCLTTGWILRRMKKFTIRVRVKCSKCFRRWTRNRKRNPNLVRWNHQASTCQRWFTSRRELFQPLLQSLKLPALRTVMKLQLMAVTLFKFVNDLPFFFWF